MRQWYLFSGVSPDDLGELIKTLSWALNFPMVSSFCEGSNRLAIRPELVKPVTIWLELFIEHFEKFEHQILCMLTEAIVELAVLQLVTEAKNKATTSDDTCLCTVVHLFPPNFGWPRTPDWVKETASHTRHYSIHKLSSGQPLSSIAKDWALRSSCLWIPKPLNPLEKRHHQWLPDNHREKVNSLHEGCTWIMDNQSKKGLVTTLMVS